MPLRRLALLTLPALALGTACFSEPSYPGDQVLGTFRFTANLDRQRSNCPVVAADAGVVDGGFALVEGSGTSFTFEGTFSRDADGGTGWFTLQGFSRDAGYDIAAQSVVSTHRAALPVEGCSGAEMEETLNAVLLSNSQNAAVGRRCSGLGDGGIPVDRDAGILPAGPNENGYDVERACGTLTDNFIPGTNVACKSCAAVFTVEGERVKQ
ncbi:hypothetical protein P2318_29345 [Myxococcaceae bacterium GXIMD 01537]